MASSTLGERPIGNGVSQALRRRRRIAAAASVVATQTASTASRVQGLRVPDSRGTEIKLPSAPLGRNLKTSLEQAHLAASEPTETDISTMLELAGRKPWQSAWLALAQLGQGQARAGVAADDVVDSRKHHCNSHTESHLSYPTKLVLTSW